MKQTSRITDNEAMVNDLVYEYAGSHIGSDDLGIDDFDDINKEYDDDLKSGTCHLSPSTSMSINGNE